MKIASIFLPFPLWQEFRQKKVMKNSKFSTRSRLEAFTSKYTDGWSFRTSDLRSRCPFTGETSKLKPSIPAFSWFLHGWTGLFLNFSSVYLSFTMMVCEGFAALRQTLTSSLFLVVILPVFGQTCGKEGNGSDVWNSPQLALFLIALDSRYKRSTGIFFFFFFFFFFQNSSLGASPFFRATLIFSRKKRFFFSKFYSYFSFYAREKKFWKTFRLPFHL